MGSFNLSQINMVRYGAQPSNAEKSAMAVKGMKVKKALAYLSDCAEHKQIIPYRRFKGDVGRKAQCKQHKGGATQGRWPKKAIELVTEIIKNAHSNAIAKGLDSEVLSIANVQVQRAPKMRRRTYRAHGRINAYKSSPCHIEMILGAEGETVPAPADEDVAIA